MDQAFSAAPDPAISAQLTPMMAQYFEIKAVNPGYLLFYRMGDFYELFFEDAEIASAALNIVLTRRGKHLGEDIKMCGVPIHAAQDYLRKLIGLGHRVAICEQVEDPAEAKKRGAKSVVRRDVVRLVTAGTLTEDELLPARGSNYLAALATLRHGERDWALAWADVSTGEIAVADLSADTLLDELSRIDPAELILSEPTRAVLAEWRLLPPKFLDLLAVVPGGLFDSETAAARLRQAFADGAVDPTSFSRAARSALGALVGYVADSQKGVGVALRPPAVENAARTMQIDAATRASLELLQTQRGTREGSLLNEIDCCVTPAGSRRLAQWLAAPLCDLTTIRARLDAVAALVGERGAAEKLRDELKSAPDISRALTRIALDRAGPRDLRAIGTAIAAAARLGQRLWPLSDASARLAAIGNILAGAPVSLGQALDAALADELPLLARDGNWVRPAYDAKLDEDRLLGRETRDVIAALQSRLAEETGLKQLKIRHNGQLGYFLELPTQHGAKLLEEPHRRTFIHRQTMVNAMRFTTAELAELEGRIAGAENSARSRENDIFVHLSEAVLAAADTLRTLADALSELDVYAAFAETAARRSWCRPEVDDTLAFLVEAGRHPVVEFHVARQGGTFVANDADLSGDRNGGKLWLLTGPNMGGKSTFLRQNALIAILAQTGAFVPAVRARLGIVDRLFSRVGASDDIAGGRSTFMVEMVETAAILNRATRKSLVILDEIGRGTATFDGLSIAWATLEALHETTFCRALFATHFHELTALSGKFSRVTNHTMRVKEWEGEVVFLHEVGQGAADRSYGLQVARLAGLPERVIERARTVLEALEMRSSGYGPAMLDDLPLFSHRPAPEPKKSDALAALLDQTRPDELTPKQALDVLYELKKLRDAARRS